jgi:hypothetical protein
VEGRVSGLEDGATREGWLDAFRRRHGRAPRILHIGNVANNAYHNAKLLTKAGFDCDVICPDYYHVMACPEWEDADFEGDPGEEFRPDWSRVELRGFQRARWFAQGPLSLCAEYLIARRAGDDARASVLWDALSCMNRTSAGTERPGGRWRRLREWWVFLVRAGAAAVSPEVVSRWLTWIGNRAVGKARAHAGAGGVVRLAIWTHERVVRPLRIVLMAVLLWWRRARGAPPEARWVSALCAAFERAFPDRRDVLGRADLLDYAWALPRWTRLLAHYDLVVAYGAYLVLPLLAGKRYFAFEHGTLREIPFSTTPTGRLAALAYHCAEHTFVTNHDCLDKARALCGDRHSFVNHPYDETDTGDPGDVRGLRARLLEELDADFLFFFPTRQDWVPGTGYADKGNDVFFRGFARLRHEGFRVGAVCCSWGRNVRDSLALLQALRCARYVKWAKPMGVRQFGRTAAACDVVTDQFKIGAFGGVTFKALAGGAAVCTYLDWPKLAPLFAEAPPVINCRTDGEIRATLPLYVDAPAKLEALRAASRSWMRRFHAGEDVVARQAHHFRRVLEEAPPGEASEARAPWAGAVRALRS